MLRNPPSATMIILARRGGGGALSAQVPEVQEVAIARCFVNGRPFDLVYWRGWCLGLVQVLSGLYRAKCDLGEKVSCCYGRALWFLLDSFVLHRLNGLTRALTGGNRLESGGGGRD